jgi:hypothetical protein
MMMIADAHTDDDDFDDDDEPRALPSATLLRTEVIAQIEASLAGKLSTKQLAGWAFNQFYKLEMGTSQPEPAYADAIEQVLDELMFADEPSFALDTASLRALLAQLEVE